MNGYLLHRDQGELRASGKTATWFKATGDTTGGLFALVEEDAARGQGAPIHRHAADVESFYVLDGEMTFFLADAEPQIGGPGTFVHVPAGAAHGFRVESERARYLILTTPHHAEFYRAMTRAVAAPGEPFEPFTKEEMGKVCRDYGVEFIAPWPDRVKG